MPKLIAGEFAPDFTAKNQRGANISLSNFKGKKVALYFYPTDDTPTCTEEACNLRDNYKTLIRKGFEVIGVSPDDVKSHKKFAEKFNLRFNLIAYPGKEIANLYGVWGEKNMIGNKYMGILRTTFINNEEGIIERVMGRVKSKDHA